MERGGIILVEGVNGEPTMRMLLTHKNIFVGFCMHSSSDMRDEGVTSSVSRGLSGRGLTTVSDPWWGVGWWVLE